MIQLQLGNAQTASEAFARALELDETLGPAWNGMGLAYLKSGNAREALTYLEKAPGSTPTSPRAGPATAARSSPWARTRRR